MPAGASALLASFLLAAAATAPDPFDTLLDAPATPDELVRGKELYLVHCIGCHGPAGEGGRGPLLAVPKLSQADTNEALIEILRRGRTEMPSARMPPADLRAVALWVRELGRAPSEPMTGSVEKGEAVFFGKGQCLTCHIVNGRGSALGPDLSEIGLRRGAAHLRRALVEPEAEVPKGFSRYRRRMTANYLQVRVTTRDGRRVDGVRVNEDTFTLQVRDLGGRVHSFLKSEIAELNKDWGKSMMPAYGRIFSKEEMDDMVAYLASLRGQER